MEFAVSIPDLSHALDDGSLHDGLNQVLSRFSFSQSDLTEVGGAISGLVGAWMLAMNKPYSRYAWLAYLVSNAFLITFSLKHGHYWLAAQMIGFTGSSLLGVWNYLLLPRYPRLSELNPFKRSRHAES